MDSTACISRTKLMLMSLALAACTTIMAVSCTPTATRYAPSSSGEDTTGQEQEPQSALIDIYSVSDSDTVYICTGKASKRFHASDSCEGIMQCTKKIITLTRADAEKRHRTFCHKCYRDSVE